MRHLKSLAAGFLLLGFLFHSALQRHCSAQMKETAAPAKMDFQGIRLSARQNPSS